jgi:hypothetical protein
MSGTDENDPYDLQRFLDAQSPVFAQVRASCYVRMLKSFVHHSRKRLDGCALGKIDP